jgi:uncharacterized protein
MAIEHLLFVLLGFAASIVSSVFGFGTALIVLALGPYILPIKETIALATVLFVASTVTKTVLFGRHIEWKAAATMALASLPFSYFGASLVAELPANLLRLMLGAMILVYLGLSTFELLPKFKVGLVGLVGGSAAYGFVSGLLGSGNLVKAVMFKEMNLSKEAFVGAMAATSVLSNAAKLTAYTNTGLLNVDLVWPMIGLALSGVVVAVLGRRFLGKISTAQFEVGFNIILAASAVGLLF